MKSIYLAARFSRRKELLVYKSELESRGYKVTSRWLTASGPRSGEDADFEFQRMVANKDLEDIKKADTLILFSEVPRKTPTRGGRLTEFGCGLIHCEKCIVIGPLENDFCCATGVEHFDTWSEFMKTIETPVVESDKFEYVKPLVAALFEATKDNLEMWNKDGEMVMWLAPDSIEEFFNNYAVTFDYNEEDCVVLTYIPKDKSIKESIAKKFKKAQKKGIY